MIIWITAGALLVAAIGTGAMRQYALSRQMLDVPNERSSHASPVPRGGGVAFVFAITLAGAILVGTLGTGSTALLWIAWLAGGVLVATAGFMDDRRGLTARTRLIAHAVAALPLIVQTGLPTLAIGGATLGTGWWGVLVAWVAVVWSVNAFNFMDGTDGIASAQAVFVCGAAAALAALLGSDPVTVGMLSVCAAAAAGFLIWNVPPAKIFMGDAGSGFLGYAVGTLALICGTGVGPSLWTWVILHALFIADATVTLATRAIQRQPLHVAHRSHVYQRLARKWKSHRRVLAAYAGINVLVLLPVAVLAARNRDAAPVIALVVLVAAAVCAAALNAGRPEREPDTPTSDGARASV